MSYVPLIIGGCCSDGIALIGDQKSAITDLRTIENHSKISAKSAILLSGIPDGRSLKELENILRNIPQSIPASRYLQILSERVRSIDVQTLSVQESFFGLLVGRQSPNSKSKLYYIDGQRNTLEINTYKSIGSGVAYAFPFLDRYYKPTMTMQKFIELGYFTIRFIEKTYSRAEVEDGYPKIRCLADKGEIDIEPSKEELLQLSRTTGIRLKQYATAYFNALDNEFA